MTYSAFGVDHYGAEIAKRVVVIDKRSESKLIMRARPLISSGAEKLRGATQRVFANPANQGKTMGELKTPLVNELSQGSAHHGLIETGRKVFSRAQEHAAAGARPQYAAAAALNELNVGDINRAATVRRVTAKPANLLRGKQTTTHQTNVITGENSSHVQREGNRFFKAKDVSTKNGETTVTEGKKGGLTGQGKALFVGGPVAGGSLGAAAYERKKSPNGY